MTRVKYAMALLGLVGMFTGEPARGQSYPVYWDVGQGSYRWAQNLIDFATETWVLLQGYVTAETVTNIVDATESAPLRESLWYIMPDGAIAVKTEPIDYGDHWELDPADWGSIITTTNWTACVLWTTNGIGELIVNYEASP